MTFVSIRVLHGLVCCSISISLSCSGSFGESIRTARQDDGHSPGDDFVLGDDFVPGDDLVPGDDFVLGDDLAPGDDFVPVSGLLFKSDFNGTVALSAPYSSNGSWAQDITGVGSGGNWASDLPGIGYNSITYQVCDTHTLGDYLITEIVPGTDHQNNSGNLWHIKIVNKAGSCGYGPPYYTASRVQFNLAATGSLPPDDLNEIHIVRWQKLAADFQSQMADNKYFQLFESIYRSDGSWKLTIKRLTGDLFWSLEDRQPGDPSGSDWVNTTLAVPQGSWFKLEIYVNYHSGSERFLVRINGMTIFNIDGTGHTWYQHDVDYQRFIAAYTDDTSGLETWISSIEIYDRLQ